MPARLPAGWKPGKGAEQPQEKPTPDKKPRSPRGSREEPPKDYKERGPYVAGALNGTVHKWWCMGYTYMSGCMRQAHQPGWKPDGRMKGRKCERCFDEG